MKLHFNKNDKGDIQVQIEKGTILIDFDYLEMLKQLIQNNQIEPEWGNLNMDEKERLNDLLEKIKNAVKTGMDKPLDK